ncbi:MAG: gliding motility protein GldN, partial [Muribaculaceae bacterium]|nr:gliding motility protein GldN [Muribaculaceae bacterium]
MKLLTKYAITALTLFSTTAGAFAQDTTSSSSSSVVRRRGGDSDRNRSEQTSPGVTDRMQQFYRQQETSDADRMWMRVIYRDLELDNPKNAALYYPEDVIDGQENLFRIIMRLLADNRIAAYEYLDGKEIFTDQYKLKVRDMLDRFHVIYSEAKGSTEKNPRYTIEESDVPANEVLSYYILERWEFDSRTNKTQRRVEAMCPVLHRSDDFGGDAVRYPMFWVKLDALRPYLSQQYIFIDDDNNLPRYTYDDFFTLSMYDGDIYKTRNLTNKSMMQLFPDPDDRKRAQDSIQNRLDTFDKNIWVPSREEVIAAREAREAAEAAALEAEAAKDEIAS